MGTRSDRGQASAELIAIVPLLLVSALALAQAVVAGWTLLSVGEAARSAARVAHVGGDPETAAGAALPQPLEPAHVAVDGAEVRVDTHVPRIIPGVPLIPVSASAALEPEASP